MKPVHTLLLAGAFTAMTAAAQSSGSANLPATNPTWTNTNVNSVGNFDGILSLSPTFNAISPSTGSTTALCNGSSSYAFAWGGTGGQQREYYNPYTGKYESAPPSASGQTASAALPYDNSVVFDADVMINIKASSYTAIFSVTDFGTTVLQADSAMSARLKIFLGRLKSDSIRESDIHVDFITMLPVYEVLPENKVFSNIATEKPAGFKIKKNVHVLFYDHRRLDQIVSDAAHAGIYDLVKVDYNVNQIEAAYDTLRKVASNVIAMKRATYEKMGFSTTILMMAEGYDSKYPEERYASYTAYIQGVSAENIEKQNPNIQVRAAEKEQTIFYNKVPYKQFDKVLNPDMSEPGVQFYYKMRVKCKMEPIKDESQKQATASATKAPAGTYRPPSGSGTQPAHKP